MHVRHIRCVTAPGRPWYRIRRSQRLALPVMFMMAWAVGCAELGPTERQMLREAARHYKRGDLTSAVTRCDRLINQFGKAPQIGEAYYIRGLCRVKQRRLKAASSDFTMALRKSNGGQLEALTQASLACLAYQCGDWRGAHRWFEKSLSQIPDNPPKDELLYTAAVGAQRAGRWEDASRWFRKILWKFGHRPVAADARRMVQWRHPYFAIQLGVFRSASNASAFVRRWRDRRVDAVQENLPRGGEPVWVVMAGRYRTYGAARDGLKRIRTMQPDAFIIP